MNEKQEELLQVLAVVLGDLEAARNSDPEAIFEIGSLAAALVDKARARSWTGLKGELTQEMYNGLVRDFQTQGNALWQAGKARKTYAIQALAVSIVSSTQRANPKLREGEALLDEMIEGALNAYRQSQRVN
jgi:predicted short-subunit dehydrogenase-like oxidoreductase (DUF2520 family)